MSKELLQSPDLENKKNQEKKDIGEYIPAKGIEGKTEKSDTHDAQLEKSLAELDNKDKIEMNIGIPKPIYTPELASLVKQDPVFWSQGRQNAHQIVNQEIIDASNKMPFYTEIFNSLSA